MNFRDIRKTFLDYFRNQAHEIVESASLIPREDPTLLFTNAGMVPFKRMFLGEEKRGYSRAATSQKCMRAGGKHNDLDNVGYTARHHTFFEMLGNFSFGDYFKEEAIVWAWELLTRGYGLSPDLLHVSVFRDDDEASTLWQEKVGLPSERIVRLDEKDNFWAMGDTGPCGPCSEIYIDQGLAVGCGRADCGPGCDCDRFLEIWNLVFTQFDRQPDGTLVPLPKPNIDTGMGLERLCAAIAGVHSNYETDLFLPLIRFTEESSQRRYGSNDKADIAFRVLADHSRAASFLVADGVIPSNEGRGYVLRRILRRAIRFGEVLGFREPFFHRICGHVVEIMGPDYRELVQGRTLLEAIVLNEEKRFSETLSYGLKILEEEMARIRDRGETRIPGGVVFRLYDTYGLSADIVGDVARDEGLEVDLPGYEAEMRVQRLKSQEAWKGSGEESLPEAYRGLMAQGVRTPFRGYTDLRTRSRVIALLVEGKPSETAPEGAGAELLLEETPFYGQSGGQAGDVGWITGKTARFQVLDTLRIGGEITVHKGRVTTGTFAVGDAVEAGVDAEARTRTALNHTATHLLHAALREVLGDHVKQAGSLVSADRLRFDFSHFAQVSQERLADIECIVNRHIRGNHPVSTTEMDKEEAMKTGAMAIFEERYGDRVRLVSVGGEVSAELCGGTHTDSTGTIGLFRIVSEGAVAANVRRIEALTGEAALLHDQRIEKDLRAAASALRTGPEQFLERVDRLLRDLRERERDIELLKEKLQTKTSEDLMEGVREIAGVKVLARLVESSSPKELRDLGDKIRDRLVSGVVVLGAKAEGKALLLCLVSKDLTGRIRAGDIIAALSPRLGGKGGGRPDMAQGGGNRPEALQEALDAVEELVRKGGK